MGMTKAVQERIFLSDSPMHSVCLCPVRKRANSRGRCSYLRKDQRLRNNPHNRYRNDQFMLTLDEAIDWYSWRRLGIERNVVYIRRCRPARS